jgi:sugar-specific transcriptional regulator TrmB
VGFEPKETQTFIDLGLTYIQAKVYLALAKYGAAKISTLSKLSDVARPDLYRTLTRLYDLGLVVKIVQAPVHFKALPIEDGIKVLLKKKHSEYEKVKQQSDALLGSLKRNSGLDFTAENSQFILIPQHDTVINRLRQAINSSQSTVDVVISWKRFMHGIGNMFAEEAKNASDRKIKYRFVVEKAPSQKINQSGMQFWQNYPSFQVRYVSEHPETVFGIYDRKELFVIVDPKSDLPGSPALWTNNSSLIALVQAYFDMLWQTAKEKPSFEPELYSSFNSEVTIKSRKKK